MWWTFTHMFLLSKVQSHPLQAPPTLHSCGICSAARWGGRWRKMGLDAKEMGEMFFLQKQGHALHYSLLKFLLGLHQQNIRFLSVLHILPTKCLDWVWDTLQRTVFKSEIIMASKPTWYSLVAFTGLCVYHLAAWKGNLICIVHY